MQGLQANTNFLQEGVEAVQDIAKANEKELLPGQESRYSAK